MPWVLQILRWSIIGLRWFFLIIHICIVAMVTLIPIDFTGSQFNPLEFSWGPVLPAGSENGIVLVASVNCIIVIPIGRCNPELQCVFPANDVYRDVGTVLPISGSSGATLEVK